MGSMAQDRRHDEMLQKAKDAVYSLEQDIKKVKSDLNTLELKHEEAKKHLDIMIDMDLARD